MSILGNRVLRVEDPKFLTSGGTYTDDLHLEGALWVTYVRSTVAHARIVVLDVEEARAQAGVVAIFTRADIDLAPVVGMPGMTPEAMARPFLADGVVRFVGEAVAVILTEQRYQGPDAAEAVFVDYEPLPVVVEVDHAVREDVLLFPDVGTNVAFTIPDTGGGEAAGGLFGGCEVVVRRTVVNQRVAPAPLEVRAAAAKWDDGRLVMWLSNQAPHAARDAIAGIYGLSPEQVRVMVPDVGGGFGAKIDCYLEEALLAWLSRRSGRPVRWTETRSESMVGLGHGRAQRQELEIGGNRDGQVLAYRLSVTQDAGAYPAIGAILPFLTAMMVPGTYAIPKVSFSARSVVTNTTPVVAYRGAGRPEATAAIERAMDLFAAEIGMDPAQVRRRNLIVGGWPYTTSAGTTYDVGDYVGALDLALQASGYDELRADQGRRREAGDVHQLGIGVSTYVEVTNGGGPTGDFGAVEILPDGAAVVYTGSSPHGQGHRTAWSMIASDQLGIPMERISFVASDTDLVARGGGTMGSRSLQSAGVAVHEASIEVVRRARELASELLEASVDDVVLDKAQGWFHVAGTPTVGRSWADVATSAAERGGLRVDHDSAPAGPTFPFGAHVAVVDIDTETGAVRLERIVAVDDAGTVLNPLLAEGQRHGGLAQGAAQALLEEVRYDPDGNPVTANLADYAFICATDLPSFELVAMETPTPMNPLGAKGIGESATIGSTPAVQSAVVDGLAHLGVRHLDMPASPEKIWRAIRDAVPSPADPG
ncbi:MAG TPA: xanthine dehydrogenase family protein molybdopterin-binding subunit [Acidimicrobiales bacterium]|nr:xanthine dehydrogenase family protein molybdopterin-binding subunit [Acidimicrobiales bacterium]